MVRLSARLAVSALAVLLVATGAWATNITLYDDDSVASSNSWYSNTGEDQEVAPNCVAAQAWDLEATLLNNRTLTLVGGWNFGSTLEGYASGDLFLATTTPQYGQNAADETPGNVNGQNNVVSNSFGYSYVLDIDWENALGLNSGNSVHYDVYAMDTFTQVQVTDTWFTQNAASDPYRYAGPYTDSYTGDPLTIGSGNLTLSGPLSDSALGTTYSSDVTGITGGNHYTATFDFSSAAWLQSSTGLWTHFTQQCGNDNLMGHTDNIPGVPEPVTMVMLGCMGAGMLGARRIKHRKSAN